MTMTRDRIEELKRKAQATDTYLSPRLEREFAAACDPKTILSLLALAERALAPQGQALPELPGRDEVHHYYWEHPIQGQTFYKYASHWSTGPAHAKPLFTADQMHAYARAYASQLALSAGPVPETYVECRECDSCGHTGMNDDDGWRAACNICGWTGAAPEEDKCPECHREGTMSAACPKCGGLYRLLATKAISFPSPAVAQPVPDKLRELAQLACESAEGSIPLMSSALHLISSELGELLDEHPTETEAKTAVAQPVADEREGGAQ